MVFETADIITLINAFKTAVPLHNIPEHFGASKRQIEVLWRKGVLQPLVTRTGRGSVRQAVFFAESLAGAIPSYRHPDKFGISLIFVEINGVCEAKLPA
ncbi:hypothetical protein SAMN04488523_101163 [Sulfitobacter brevis]|uniref:Uncharacterized protein n=2 Tax=Sulfitobacter brevis TaxID=74348 RepID=A0A1I1SUC0_9RHOB|nr:hypothetical protein SAMN04488523_101163 [Sulfitobacter brevis]